MKEKYMQNQFNELLQKSVRIFQLQVFDQQNKAKITPLYAGFEELKMRCQKMNKNQVKTEQKSSSKQLFYPVVWVDYQTSSVASQNGKQTEIFSLNQFQQVLKNFQISESNFGSNKNSENSLNIDLKDKILNLSPPLLIQKKKLSNTPSTDDNIFITAKPLKPQFSNQNNQQINNTNIILIHMKLFTNINKFSRLSDDILSLGIYLSDHMVVNFTGNNNQSSLIERFTECLEQKVGQIKNSGQNKKKYRVDVILSEEIKIQIGQNRSFIKFHSINKGKKQQSIREFEKIKDDITQRLSFKVFDVGAQNQMKLQGFLKKCEIAARILTNPPKKSLFFSQQLFSQQKITEKEKQLLKQSDLQQQHLIRSKLQYFYDRLRFSNKKQFPMHDSVIDFKLDEFCGEEFKEKVRNKKLLERIKEEYRQKMHETNVKQIKKLLLGSLKEYIISGIMRRQSINEPVHPQSITSLISQYHTIINQNHPFISHSLFTEITYPKIYSQYYSSLYEQYKRVKQQNDNNDRVFEQKTRGMREQMEKQREKVRKVEEQNKGYKVELQGLKQEVKVGKVQLARMSDQLIVWKQKAIHAQQQLAKQQQAQKKQQEKILNLQQKLNILQSKMIQTLLSGETKSYVNTPITSQHLLSMQKAIAKQTTTSFTLMQQFQTHLNNYKAQYHQLEHQLKEKHQLLIEKQDYYKEKITLLQTQLQMKSDCQLQSIQTTHREKQINAIKQQQLRQQIQKQYNEKLQWKQSQYENKTSNYHLHVQQLQSIIKSNHQNITYLNQEIYLLKKTVLGYEESTHNMQSKMRDIQKVLSEKVKESESKNVMIVQKDKLIEQLTVQNDILTNNVSDKQSKLDTLQNSIQKLSIKAFTNNNENFQTFNNNNNINMSKSKQQRQRNNSSFLRFSTQNDDHHHTILDNSSAIFNSDITTKSVYSNITTPMKRTNSSRLKQQQQQQQQQQTINEIKQNIQLEKLIEQRKTIEKPKQNCAKREILLQDLYKGDSGVFIKSGVMKIEQQPFFSNQSTICNLTHRNQAITSSRNSMHSKVLKQSNRSAKNDEGLSLQQQNDSKLRKKLF